MKKNLYTVLLALFPILLNAQNFNLPHWETQFEQEQKFTKPNPTAHLNKDINPLPPPAPVRTMGEWEEVQGIVITWDTSHNTLLAEIVRHALPECTVYIVTDNLEYVLAKLAENNVPADDIQFLIETFDSIWIRDYGPWTVYQNDVDSLNIVDWIYNRPRANDDVIPAAVASLLNITMYEATQVPFDWVHTGGNHLQDGMNTAFSSDLVIQENPGRIESEIDDLAQSFLGVDRYIKLRRLPFDVIHHLDMHMRLIDEETIFFGEYPEGQADGPQINANIDYLRNTFLTPFGNTYNILRMPMPPDQFGDYPNGGGDYRTYTNSLFINKTIIVPIYEEQYDTTALRLYREMLPGYNIVGIDCNDIISRLGALHCITKLIGVANPLRIAHARLRDTYDTENAYTASAIIQHHTGIEQATLYYRTEAGGDYTAVSMTLTDPDADIWSADIPAQNVGTQVQYYIQASAFSGKEQQRPIVAPEGYFYFKVKGYTQPPVAQALYNASSQCMGSSFSFRNDSQGGVTDIEWLFPGGEPATSTEANPTITYNTPGLYDVTMIVSNPEGADTLILNGAVSIEEPVLPFEDDFTNGPNASWQIDNPDADGALWTLTQTDCSGNCFMVDNRNFNTRFKRDYFSALIDLTGLENPTLTFDVAYARRHFNFDELRINVVRCNGEKVNIFNKSSVVLATAPNTNGTFIPNDCSLWRNEVVSLTPFIDEIIRLEFEAIGGNGNRLYIDNIDINSSPNQAPTVYLESPDNGSLFEEISLPTIPIIALADDMDGTIEYVTFFIDGDSVGIATEIPYTYPFEVPAFGFYDLQVRATDDDGAESYSSMHQIEVRLITKITETKELPFTLKLYPNPVANQLFLNLESSKNLQLDYQLINQLGQEIMSGGWAVNNGPNSFQLAMHQLPPGVYSLHLRGDDWNGSWKVMVVRD
ncbi:MAG: hypothetical protein DHS20C18_10360 [Saprospiraceae bacterium]|nr:MAG: hypothetical protein DHS20C18_10360 [Saprospiraceae bacterium]